MAALGQPQELTKEGPQGAYGRVRKVALIAPYDYAYRGGVNTHIMSLARAYKEMGLSVRVIAACSSQTRREELLINASASTIRIKHGGTSAYISISPRAYTRVRDALRRENFDVVHLHEPLTPAIPFYALLHSRAVNVGTFHAYKESTFLSFYQAAVALRPLMERLDGRIAVSPAARDYVARFFPGEYVIIPNGIDYDFYATPAPPIARFADGSKANLLFVGRLDKRKGFRYLLEAYELIKRACPEVRLIAVGAFRHDEAEPYLEFVEKHRLPDVHLIGYVSDEELRRYYHTADIVCAPSTGDESFGYVLIEAMAAGKPVVASDIPGYRYVLEDGLWGVLVPPGDPEALAAAICRLVREPSYRLALGEAGRARAAQFSWKRVALAILDYYNELLQRKQAQEASRTRIC